MGKNIKWMGRKKTEENRALREVFPWREKKKKLWNWIWKCEMGNYSSFAIYLNGIRSLNITGNLTSILRDMHSLEPFYAFQQRGEFMIIWRWFIWCTVKNQKLHELRLHSLFFFSVSFRCSSFFLLSRRWIFAPGLKRKFTLKHIHKDI